MQKQKLPLSGLLPLLPENQTTKHRHTKKCEEFIYPIDCTRITDTHTLISSIDCEKRATDQIENSVFTRELSTCINCNRNTHTRHSTHTRRPGTRPTMVHSLQPLVSNWFVAGWPEWTPLLCTNPPDSVLSSLARRHWEHTLPEASIFCFTVRR